MAFIQRLTPWLLSVPLAAAPPRLGALDLLASVDAPRAALAGEPIPVGISFLAGGQTVQEPVLFYLRASAGVFSAQPLAGRLVSGGGSSRVLLETEVGRAAIPITVPHEEAIELTVEDGGSGAVIPQEIIEDFEFTDGGFIHAGVRDDWEWGVPTSGPLAARSGRRLWATNLDGPISQFSNAYLQTPPRALPAAPPVTFAFFHWYHFHGTAAKGRLLIAAGGGDFQPFPGLADFEYSRLEFSPVELNLASFAGQTVQFRFLIVSDGFSPPPGWYIDDVRLIGPRRAVRVLAPGFDADGDGAANQDEMARGTNPILPDTDGDLLADAAETDTGVFAGAADTGTDPLLLDTDAGGELDGAEVAAGRRPLDPADDLVRAVLNVHLADEAGFDWDVLYDGSIATRGFSQSFRLVVDGTVFPNQTSALIDRAREAVWIGPAVAGRLEVTRSIFVPSTGGSFIRYLEVLHNPGDVPVATTLEAWGRVGSGGDTRVLATSSGNTVFDAADRWLATTSDSTGNYPATAYVLSGASGSVHPAEARLNDGNFFWSYAVTVPPRTTVGLMYFGIQNPEEAGAVASAEALYRLDGRALDALRAPFPILNFDASGDTDGDGIPDAVEAANGLDPGDEADGAADGDGDGLSNLSEFLAGTAIGNPDTDGDTLADGDEVLRRKTDPLRADTDGDGLDDAEDPDPLTPERNPDEVTLPKLLRDGEGYNWSVERRSHATGDSQNQIGPVALLQINSIQVPETPTALMAAGGGSLAVGPLTAGPLAVTRHVFVPAQGDGFIRYLDVFRNITGAAVTAEITFNTQVSAQVPVVHATSNGDFRFDQLDDWAALDTVSLAIAGSPTPLRPLGMRLQPNRRWEWSYTLTVPPGESRTLLQFTGQSADPAGAAAKAERLARLEGRAGEGIPAALWRSIVNFPHDSDGDLIPDHLEVELGLSPEDPTDGAADADGDGLANAEEYLAGSNHLLADSDGDGLSDAEEVREIGSHPGLADTDGDGAADGADPYPASLIVARLTLPASAEAGVPFAAEVRLTARGAPVMVTVPFSLDAGQNAIFGTEATRGRLVRGSGTGSALLEAVAGVAAVPVTPGTGSALSLLGADTAGYGITFEVELVEDFEISNGGFTHAGVFGAGDGLFHDPWTWGVPTTGPRAAASGRRAWATNLHANYPDGGDYYLESPTYTLPVSRPFCEFRHWFAADRERTDFGQILISSGGPFTPFRRFADLKGVLGGYSTVKLDLADYAGRTIRVRFLFSAHNGTPNAAGWYVDDFRMAGTTRPIRVLDPAADADGDGVATAVERSRGTSPVLADTDGDGLADGVETATGTFAGELDTGSDPLAFDSDGGGMPDGREVLVGLAPQLPEDDYRRRPFPFSAFDASGYFWDFDRIGAVEDGTDRAFAGALRLSLNGFFFPAQAEAFVEPRGEAFWLGPARMMASNYHNNQAYDSGPLDVSRQVFIASTGEGLARYTEILHNPGDSVVLARLQISGQLGAGSSTEIVATSSGDQAVDAADDWVIAEGFFASGHPTVALVFAGANAPVRPSRVVLGSDGGFFWGYDVRVPPGETVAIQHFAAQCPDVAAATSRVALLHTRLGRTRDGLGLLARKVLNFSGDADGDGIPDEAEILRGLDPEDPADAALDGDGDGLTNIEEYQAGTDGARIDSDGDGLTDGDEVHAAGTNPLAADTDRDGVPDGADPHPAVAFVARLDIPRWALLGDPVPVRVLLSAAGGPVDLPLRFRLVADGPATFADSASVGRVLAGGGTSAVLLETADGEARIALSPAAAGRLVFRVEDPAAQGIVFRAEVREDFEAANGGFAAGGAPPSWSWGGVALGPRFARSGERAWSVALPANSAENGQLTTPAFELLPATAAQLEFWHWHDFQRGFGRGRILVSVDGGPFLRAPLPDDFRGKSQRYERAALDLSPHAGHAVRFRLEVVSGGSWIIDDFSISGGPRAIQVLDPAGDFDQDGLASGDEAGLGSDPLARDGDGDGLADGRDIELGLNPARADSDGGGMRDGEEVFYGLDPLLPGDDFRPGSLPVTFRDLEGFDWDVGGDGIIDDHVIPALDRAMLLWVGDPFGSGRDARFSPTGETILVGPVAMGDLDVTRQIHLPASRGTFARYAEVLTNTGKVDIQTSVLVSGDLSTNHSTRVLATSDGDRRFGPADEWLVAGSSSTATPPVVTTIVDAGASGSVRPSRAALAGDVYTFQYDVRVPAGGTVALLHFAAKSLDEASALARARDLARLAGLAGEGLDSPLGRSLANFAVDLDGDGIPDEAEERFGLDPRDAADAARDADEDGLDNLGEFLAGSDPRQPDTDGDGLSDREEVEERGTHPARPDTDGDGRGDGADPFPGALILARLNLPSAAVVGVPATLRLDLTAGEAALGTDVPFLLRVAGGATFALEAAAGTVLAGGGTEAVLLRSRGGEAAIDVTAGRSGSLTFTLEDPESYGIRFRAEVFEDFESSHGGFTHGGAQDEWQWGVPLVGPNRGRSGRRAWGTDLDGNYGHNGASYLETPIYRLPAAAGLELEFWQWITAAGCCDEGNLLVSVEGAFFEEVPDLGPFRWSEREYERVALDLSPYAGKQVQFRFLFTTDAADSAEGWYLDDFRLHGPPLELALVDPEFGSPLPLAAIEPAGDADEDGMTNGEELRAGTDPFLADTDGGGAPDGEEVSFGLDPLDPADDAQSIRFLRGDADRSGHLNITDPIVILHYLFLGGQAPAFLDAADLDDDGRLNITDPILLLDFLFRGGRPPRPPYPEPGPDPTADALPGP